MKIKQKYLDSTKKWRENNKDRIKEISKEWRNNNKEKVAGYRDNYYFGRSSQEVLERDNFQCVKCGMNQEQHIVLFGTRLQIHHEDEKGRRKSDKNNDLDNLITVCIRCHATEHRTREMIKRYGELMDQDDSQWAFPKLRKLVLDEISKGNKVGEAKKIVAKSVDLSYTTVDHRYYEKKSDMRSIIQKRRLSKQGSKK